MGDFVVATEAEVEAPTLQEVDSEEVMVLQEVVLEVEAGEVIITKGMDIKDTIISPITMEIREVITIIVKGTDKIIIKDNMITLDIIKIKDNKATMKMPMQAIADKYKVKIAMVKICPVPLGAIMMTKVNGVIYSSLGQLNELLRMM